MESALTATTLDRQVKAGIRQAAWTASCNELILFHREHAAFPSRYKKAERRLAIWLQYQRRKYHAGGMPRHEIEALSIVDNWFASPFTTGAQWQDRLKAFVDEHGRKPSLYSDSEDERALCRAMMRHKLSVPAGSVVTSVRKQALDELWEANLAALSRWIDASGRLPKMRAPDPEESRLANFINVQRRNLAAGKIPSAMEEKLRTLPGVLAPRPKDRPASEWQVLLDAFEKEHRRCTSQTGGPAERSLHAARFRHNLVSGFGRSAAWETSMTDVENWLASGKAPRTSSDAADEARLGRWIAKQRAKIRSGAMPAEQLERFNRAVPSRAVRVS